jgi:8-hydroxy-5-deazaflavin:NADPH oxidoreductase
MTTIAIIGTGNVGSALGGSLARAGHSVVFAARDAAKAAETAASLGARSVATPAEAVAGADVVILAVPFSAAADVAAEIASGIAGTVVIDSTNPIKPDYSGLATAGGPSAAETIAAALPGARVVKAFNTVFASNQGNPTGLGAELDALIAADDDAAAGDVAALASSIGFRPVKVGPLAAARELEALAWLNIRLQLLTGGSWQTAYQLVAAPDAAILSPAVVLA